MNELSNAYPTDFFQALDAKHHLHPFSDHGALRQEGARVIVKGEGVWLTDSDGNRIMDGMAGLWNVQVGHGRTEIVDAVANQMRQLSYYNTFFKTTHPPVVALSQRLAQLAPEPYNQFFYVSSGSEANDTVLRLVRYYWDLKGKPEKKTIITRWNAYHGSTVAGTSLGGMTAMHAQGDLPIPGIHHIDQPYWFGEGGEMSPDEFGVHAAQKLAAAIDALGEDKVAAFMAEPIQGAGGVVIPPDSYWPEIKRVLAERDVLLVADEVISGFGRLGEWFGLTHYDIEPDLVSLAKGLTSGYLPMGAVMVHDRVASIIEHEGGEFFHGTTYAGHPACAAAAFANLGILANEGVVEHVRDQAAPHMARLYERLGEHPLVGEARTRGLLGALELVPNKPSRARFANEGDVGTICRDVSFSQGLVMRAVRDTMILSPPLIISAEELDWMADTVWRVLDLTGQELKRRGLW
ncbi:MAG: aspartate aminotransferase family protein [Devosiaceae bacterium]|nr:aspartate aminotransferase family protein [Devosiaceae bacterium MH13]